MKLHHKNLDTNTVYYIRFPDKSLTYSNKSLSK